MIYLSLHFLYLISIRDCIFQCIPPSEQCIPPSKKSQKSLKNHDSYILHKAINPSRRIFTVHIFITQNSSELFLSLLLVVETENLISFHPRVKCLTRLFFGDFSILIAPIEWIVICSFFANYRTLGINSFLL